MRYYVTNPQVIHETIDGETIIIDLQTGTYFSLQGSAPEIWTALTEGKGDDEILGRLRADYETDESELTVAVTRFLEELEGVQLIAQSDSAAPTAVQEVPPTRARGEFVAPKLERFTDMQEIILLDPVHKVDAQGWPHAAPSPESA